MEMLNGYTGILALSIGKTAINIFDIFTKIIILITCYKIQKYIKFRISETNEKLYQEINDDLDKIKEELEDREKEKKEEER